MKPAYRTGRRILVVDDEPAVRALVVASLESGDWAVETVADGAGVFEALSVQRPDLILLDVGLPRLSGCEVLRRLRADETTASIPVVLMTGLEPPEDARPDGVLHKPFTPSLLIESVSSFLS